LTDGGTLNIVRPVADGGAALRSAHTLDSGDRVYGSIAVRRTLIFIDQSIRAALSRFVFAPNSPPTWVAVEDLVSRFLLRQWRLGCLSGDRPSRAFTVQCGLGSTMTADDVQNGRLIVELTLQFPEPCGLVELTLTQEVQGVS
jgi:phage tail sheath protein FI